MPDGQRAQISLEYLIVVSFVTLLIIGLLGTAFFYSSRIGDQLRFSNLNRFASTLTTNAEEVYYAGEPSRITVRPYLPPGVTNVTIGSDYILFSVSSQSGVNLVSYHSSVPLQGALSASEGIKRIQLIAQSNHVLVQEG